MKDFNAEWLATLHCPKCGWWNAKPTYSLDRPDYVSRIEYLRWLCNRCGYCIAESKCADAKDAS